MASANVATMSPVIHHDMLMIMMLICDESIGMLQSEIFYGQRKRDRREVVDFPKGGIRPCLLRLHRHAELFPRDAGEQLPVPVPV
jgi:hypothetical protein